MAAGLVLAACGSPSTPSAAGQIKKDWVAFFSGTTPAAKKAKLLENGSELLSLLESQSASYAKDVSVKVSKVSLTSKTAATVTYDIYLGTQDVLQGRTGTAIKQSGVWKVSLTSFCGLLELEGVNAKACSASSS